MDRIVIMGTNNKSFSVIYNGEVVSRSILQIQDDLRLLKKGKAQRVRIRDKDLLIYYKGGIVTLKSYRELGHNCPATRDYIAHVKKYIKLSTKAKHVGALVVASSIALGMASFKSNKVQAENNDMTVTSTKVLDDMHDLSGSYTMNNNPNFNIHDYENITIPEDDVEVLDTTPTLDVPTEDSEKQCYL